MNINTFTAINSAQSINKEKKLNFIVNNTVWFSSKTSN